MGQQSLSARTFLGLSGDNTSGKLEVYSLGSLYWQACNICDVFSVSKDELLLIQRPASALIRERAREDDNSGHHDARSSSVPRLSLAHSSPFSSASSPPITSGTLASASYYLQDISTYRSPASLPGFSSNTSIPASPLASSSPSINSGSLSLLENIHLFSFGQGLGFLDLLSATSSAVALTPYPLCERFPLAATAMSVAYSPQPIPNETASSVSTDTAPLDDAATAETADNAVLHPSPAHNDIYIPSLAIARWPNGMYACEMARGFALMVTSKRASLKDKFQDVFHGVKFKSNTVYQHYNA
ncbi:hypothetical protein LXA43DRAFT_1062865 [Ganoderma leucocontextum]|nr:hypothetical protein LXA43DRAFT_1062865 [Ganoderma leucocontextum]